MGNKKNFRNFDSPQSESPRRDNSSRVRKTMLEMEHSREADMEVRSVLGRPQSISVVCSNCKTRTTFEIGQGVPVSQCPKCGFKVSLRPSFGRYPEVTSR